jgi:hypothetical protein
MRPGGPSVAPVMLWPLLAMLLGFACLYLYLLLTRVRLERVRHRAVELRLKRGRRG